MLHTHTILHHHLLSDPSADTQFRKLQVPPWGPQTPSRIELLVASLCCVMRSLEVGPTALTQLEGWYHAGKLSGAGGLPLAGLGAFQPLLGSVVAWKVLSPNSILVYSWCSDCSGLPWW